MREFKSVHDAHCCKIHGCMYGHQNCPVQFGTEEGVRCEDCRGTAGIASHSDIELEFECPVCCKEDSYWGAFYPDTHTVCSECGTHLKLSIEVHCEVVRK